MTYEGCFRSFAEAILALRCRAFGYIKPSKQTHRSPKRQTGNLIPCAMQRYSLNDEECRVTVSSEIAVPLSILISSIEGKLHRTKRRQRTEEQSRGLEPNGGILRSQIRRDDPLAYKTPRLIKAFAARTEIRRTLLEGCYDWVALVDILHDKFLSTGDPASIKQSAIKDIGSDSPESAKDNGKELRGIGLYDQAAGEFCFRFLSIDCTEFIFCVFRSLLL